MILPDSNVFIRYLNGERWAHIVENHDALAGRQDDVLDAIADPQAVFAGQRGTLLARKPAGKRRWIVVVYREVGRLDGFVITAFFARKRPPGRRVWPR